MSSPSKDPLAERLKKDKDHHHSINHNHDFHRRRHHRRANKRGRRPHHRHPRDFSPPTSSAAASSSAINDSKGQKRPPVRNLVLRPTKGPLLNAPKNSTQFIIDDHEAPAAFLESDELEAANKKYNTRSRQASSSSSRRVSATDDFPDLEAASKSPEKAMAAEPSATPGNYVVNDDDYTSWAEFSERDFQKVYESAHQEQVADWDRQRLIEEITSLEKKQKELVNILARVDPEMYAQKLQNQLAALQEKNRVLKSQINGQNYKSPTHQDQSPDSSTKE